MRREFGVNANTRPSFRIIRSADQSPAASRSFPLVADEGEERLTKREHEVLSCLAEGESTEAIAKRFSISRTTVRNHVQAILRKLGVHTKLAAVVYAYRQKLI